MSLHKKQLANGLRRRTRILVDSSRWKLLNAEKLIVFGVWSTDCNPACRANVKIPAIRSISPLAKTLCRQRLTRGGSTRRLDKTQSVSQPQRNLSALPERPGRHFISAVSHQPRDCLSIRCSSPDALRSPSAITCPCNRCQRGDWRNPGNSQNRRNPVCRYRYWSHLFRGSWPTPNGWHGGADRGPQRDLDRGTGRGGGSAIKTFFGSPGEYDGNQNVCAEGR